MDNLMTTCFKLVYQSIPVRNICSKGSDPPWIAEKVRVAVSSPVHLHSGTLLIFMTLVEE